MSAQAIDSLLSATLRPIALPTESDYAARDVHLEPGRWPRERAAQVRVVDLLHVIYERIDVAGPPIVSVGLTLAAYSHGLALVLPEVVRARPTGFERADAINIRIPIEGVGEAWSAGESA